jgi:hypothetical protein
MSLTHPSRPRQDDRPTVVRTSVGWRKATRIRQVSESVTVVVRSSTYTAMGIVCILMSVAFALILADMLRCRGVGCRPPGEATGVMGVFSVVVGVQGWILPLCSSMTVTSWGVSVVNPLATARVAWADLAEAYVLPNGLSLRIRTTTWTIGVFPIQVSNWEGWFARRANRAEVWAGELNDLRDRFQEVDGTAGSAGPAPRKVWRIRVLPLVLAVAPWLTAVLLFHPSLAGL